MGIIDALIDWLARTFFGMKDAVTQPSQTQTTQTQPSQNQAPVSNDIAAGAATPTAGSNPADVPPSTQRWDMYKVVVEESGIPANQVKDISVSSDGKTLAVRMYDGTEKTIPSRAPWQVTNPEGKHYIVKVGMEQFQVVPGKPKQYPTVYDLGGYPDTAYGQIAPDGVYYDSFLDWCKRHYGTAPDPLGLKYREAHQEEMGPALAKWSMEYEKVGAIVAPTPGQTVPGARTVTSQTTVVEGNQTITTINYSDGTSERKVSDNPVAKTIYSGGTAYNAPAPSVKCNMVNGNYQCYPI